LAKIRKIRGLGVLQARDFGRSQNIPAKSCILVLRRHHLTIGIGAYSRSLIV